MLAEFDTPTDLVVAAKAAYAAGYRKMDAYSPFPDGGGQRGDGLPQEPRAADCAAGRNAGRVSGYALQYWINVISYPLNIGGKPYDSWPAFIVPTFELTILFAGLCGVFGMFALNGLPCRITRCSMWKVWRGDARQVLPVRGGGRSQFRHG